MAQRSTRKMLSLAIGAATQAVMAFSSSFSDKIFFSIQRGTRITEDGARNTGQMIKLTTITNTAMSQTSLNHLRYLFETDFAWRQDYIAIVNKTLNPYKDRSI
jgi:hypothetical protein